jgi:hypothetical protein
VKKLKITSVVLVLAMLCSVLPMLPAAADTDGIIFGMLSDTHNGNEKPHTAPRLQKAVSVFNSIAGLSAVGVAGDMTNQWGLESDYQSFSQIISGLNSGIQLIASMGNHEANTPALFEQYTGSKPNAHYVIDGYHFIAISPGYGALDETTGRTQSHGEDNYSFVADWAVRQMQAAVADDPNKPVFVLMHHALDKTHYLTDSRRTYHGNPAGVGDGTASIFSNFPQAVVFSGHIHTPNNDPRSIWQDGGFTTVNVPGFDKIYLEPDAMILGQSPPSALDVAQGLVVEAEGSVVTIKTYDFEADCYLDQVWTFDVSNPQSFPYTAARVQAAQKPVFGQNANLTAAYNGDLRILNVSFDQAALPAASTVGEIVYSYRFDVIDRATGAVAHTFRSWSDFWYQPMPSAVSLALEHSKLPLAPQKTYTLKVYPTGSFGLTGDGFLSADFDTMSAEEPFDPDMLVPPAEVMDVDYSDTSQLNNASGGNPVTAGASPSYTFDTQLFKNVSNHTGKGAEAFTMPLTAPVYTMIESSMSLEVTFMVSAAANGTAYTVVSNMESGGFGVVVRGNNTNTPDLEFHLNIGGTYRKAIAAKSVAFNEWYHAVATYDNSTVRLYLNGEQAAAVPATGAMKRSTTGSADKLVIGGDPDAQGRPAQYLFLGKISETLLYSRPLTKHEAKARSIRALGSHHPLDITRLTELIDAMRLLNPSDYNTESWDALTEAIAAAVAVVTDPNAAQSDIDDACDALTAALTALGSAPIRTDGIRVVVKEIYGMWQPVFRLSEL